MASEEQLKFKLFSLFFTYELQNSCAQHRFKLCNVYLNVNTGL